MARTSIHHVDFRTLVMINKTVVSLTKELHEYSAGDEVRIKQLLKDVASAPVEDGDQVTATEKASLLIFRVAAGQDFHEGNKRTALVAASAFLRMNGYSLDLRDEALVSVVDKAGMAAATLDDVRLVVGRLVKKSRGRGRLWKSTVAKIVAENKDFLAYIASENRT